MRAFVLCFVIALVSTAVLIPPVRWFAIRLGAVSTPGGRNINVKQIPRLGGIAVVLGFLAPLVALLATQSAVAAVLREEATKIASLLAGAILLATVGGLDDTRRIRVLYKLAAQVAAATLAYVGGFQIAALTLPVFGNLSMGVFAFPVTVFWIVGIVNAINLIDGLDGLAAGVVFCAGITSFTVAVVAGNVFVAVLMACMLGAVLGFLFFNFNPARIFMGDSGSYFLGFLIGTTSLAGASQKASATVSILVPILALGLPIFDTLFSIVRRFLARRSIFSADRGHVHHRLLDMGLTHRRAVLLLYGISVVMALAAIGVSLGRSWQIGVAILCASAVIVGLVRFAGYFESVMLIRKERAGLRNPDTEIFRRLLTEVPLRLAAADSEQGVLSVLEELVADGHLAAVELSDPAAPAGALPSWARGEPDPAGELLTVSFPVGPEGGARVHMRMRWRAATDEVSPQAEVLLQVLVDMTAGALARVDGTYAPGPVPLAKRVESEPPLVADGEAHHPWPGPAGKSG